MRPPTLQQGPAEPSYEAPEAHRETAEQLLKRRALEIAEDPGSRAQERAAEEDLELLEFRLAHEAYALPSAQVAEVVALREYAVLPFAPALLLGVAYVRGRMLSVFDVRPLLNLPASQAASRAPLEPERSSYGGPRGPGLTELNRVIVVSHAALEIGILADTIERIITLNSSRLTPALPAGPGHEGYCSSITPGGASVLNMARLLAALSPGLVER